MKKLICRLRGLWSTYVLGRRWHGHCWSLETGHCVDCGYHEEEEKEG
jgi:hypothetical protein